MMIMLETRRVLMFWGNLLSTEYRRYHDMSDAKTREKQME
jgi:hypothetical protein